MIIFLQELSAWRHRPLVLVLQVLGLFPYSWARPEQMQGLTRPSLWMRRSLQPRPPTPVPVFSTKLFLWGTFLQLVSIAVTCLMTSTVLISDEESDIGGLAFQYTRSAAFLLFSFSPTLFMLRGSKLAAALVALHDDDMEEEVMEHPDRQKLTVEHHRRVKALTSKTHFINKRAVFMVLILLAIISMSVFIWFTFLTSPVLSVTEVIAFSLTIMYTNVANIVAQVFLKISFSKLGHQLVDGVVELVKISPRCTATASTRSSNTSISSIDNFYQPQSSPLHELK